MKNMKNIITLLVVALMGLSLTACSNDDLDTNQYKGGVSLNAFGPNPVVRGGQLRFVGSNLDQIASIQIPGVSAITNYEVVKSGVPSEIRVTVPKDGPLEGLITLTTKTDEKITTKNELTYTESIEFESFSPASAMPGDVVTIKGDYLNLIYSLSFADGIVIGEEDFLTHDRYTITVAVPEEAQTGKIELYTADLTVTSDEELDYQIISSDDAIEIGTPAISSLKGRNTAEALGNITAKAGEKIAVTGTYFNVVDAIKVGGVETEEIAVAEDGKALEFTLPADAPDGDIVIICKSGVEVPVGTLTNDIPEYASQEISVRIALPAVYNIYNAAAALSAYLAAALPLQEILRGLADVHSSFGRMEHFNIGRVSIQMILVKNPAGCNQALDYLCSIKEPCSIVLCLNDLDADGHDISWIWDVDYEKLCGRGNIRRILVWGRRAEDLQLRLKYAGFEEKRIRRVPEKELKKLLDAIYKSEVPVFILPNYTTMLPLRDALRRAAGKDSFCKG